ncbi:MAG: hypothetical protein R2706_10350 [Acidimicrobiales bacterium]
MGQMIATQLIELVDNIPGYLTSAQQWAKASLGVEIDTESLANEVKNGRCVQMGD